MENKIKEIHNIISEWDNEDETISRLQKAVDFFCGNYDICEGLKYSLQLTLDDQFDNHKSELEEKDIDELLDILNGAI